MAGPVLSVELADPVRDDEVAELRRLLTGLAARFEEERPGDYDVGIVAERLSLDGGERPFLVTLPGPAHGDADTFEAEHAAVGPDDGPDLLPLIGFRPTHSINVAAMCNDQADHKITALLTAATMDIVGGVAYMEVYDDRAATVAGLPGLMNMVWDRRDTRWRIHTAFGTASYSGRGSHTRSSGSSSKPA